MNATFMKKLKKIPKFANEDAERDFWANHSFVDYLDWSKAKHAIFPNLKPTTESISLRLPLNLLHRLKVEANKRDVPYQSLIKVVLDKHV